MAALSVVLNPVFAFVTIRVENVTEIKKANKMPNF